VVDGESFETFFTELSQKIVAQQQQKIQNILWELNDYLMYILVWALLGLFIFRLYARYKT
jgi:hypothetical protein